MGDSGQPTQKCFDVRRLKGYPPVNQKNRPFAGFGDPNSSGFGVPSKPKGWDNFSPRNQAGPRYRPGKLDHGPGLKSIAKQKECDQVNPVNQKRKIKPKWRNPREGTQPLFTGGFNAQSRLPLSPPSPQSPLLPSHLPDLRITLRERLNPGQIDLLLKICDLVAELRLD